jgi:hypothetical protein
MMYCLLNKIPKFSGVLLLFSFIASSAPISTGEHWSTLILPDQNGNRHTLRDTTLVLFAPDKAAGELAHEVLRYSNNTEMAAKNIVFISDISRMPSLIRRMFALPAMRDYPYRVLLGYEEEETAMLPRQAGKVTVLRIHSGEITQIEFADSPASLVQMTDIEHAPPANNRPSQ